MQNILFMTLNLLLTAVIAAVPFRIANALSCYDGQSTHVVALKRLAYGSPATITFEDGQRVKIASDSGGKALVGKVALETSSGAILYFQDAATAPDISASLVAGTNAITLMGNEDKHFWLITESPCPIQIAEATKPAPSHAVIAPQLDNESAPLTKPQPVIRNEPAPVATPAPVPADDVIGLRHVLVFALTLLVFLARVIQLGWILGAIMLLLAGGVFAYRRRDTLWNWVTHHIRTIRKEVWHS